MYGAALGRRLVHAADEYYLMADRPFPAAETYEGFTMHEDGIGMARTFELEFTGRPPTPPAPAAASSPPSTPRRRVHVPLPPNPAAYTGLRSPPSPRPRSRCGRAGRRPIGVLSGELGARVLAPLLDSSAATTCGSSPSPTSSSAATPASPA